MAYQVILVPGIGQFREFGPRRVHINVRTFSCVQIDLRKAREREFAAFNENRPAVGLLNLCAIKIERKNRGGEGTTPVTTACPEAGK